MSTLSSMAVSWRSAAADAMEAKEEAVLGAVRGLDGLDGMYAERPEIRDMIQSLRGLLEFDAENLRNTAARLRDGA